MAKRKRLTPARIPPEAQAPETKSSLPRYPMGIAPAAATRPPIADVAHDASATAALTEVAQTLSDARAEGRLIQSIPLDAVQDDYLVRDRMAVDPAEMATLTESLKARGQQTAIEVTALENGQYGLISGWRRLTALRQMRVENPEIDSVLALIRTPQDAASAYVAMVEENEIRVGLSYYERARIVARAVDRGVYRVDRVALPALFHAASRPKRSKIGSFLKIVRALDEVLRFPTALTEKVGLALAQALEADETLASRLTVALTQAAPTDATAEALVITRVLQGDAAPGRPTPKPLPQIAQVRPGLRMRAGKAGQIVLEGPALEDGDFRDRLLAWLQDN